MEVKFSIKKIA